MNTRVCIYGTGAIGGFLAARLAHAGKKVSCVARGDQLEAIRSQGLRLIEPDHEIDVETPCSDNPDELGVQDIVIVTLKAHALADNVDGIASLLGPNSVIVTAQNGLPWWYFYRDASPLEGRWLESVDPGGQLWKRLGPERAIGAIVYPAAAVVAPGVIRHVHGENFTLGEPGGGRSDRIVAASELLSDAGLQVSITDDIRAEIWLKLAVNAAINPLSVIENSTITEIIDDSSSREQLAKMIGEAQSVAASVGVAPMMSVEELIDAMRGIDGHKTSMLIDYESDRPMELDALTGAILEIASQTGAATPYLSAIFDEISQRLRA
ncbi:MAG: 2-dehydropantoate 2-reductase [Gammaproteobacteria bacterium]|nr:2-dehydropantoate 2-reductase [Gammaproteobacteria bacterium]MBT8444240.1 2-dehydropantoate 2-reductase [Gammaproteobacteria bacterium]NND37670.1 2-dehydropantoate 2-reductase [Gammaproteobacteria bacterium]